MEELSILDVNLREGFLLSASKQIVAAFSRHQKTIVWKTPSAHKHYALPNNLITFYQLYYETDSFSISAWSQRSSKTIGLTDLIQLSET